MGGPESGKMPMRLAKAKCWHNSPSLRIAKFVQEPKQVASLPLRASGLELQPAKTQVWAPRMHNIMRTPALRGLHKDPRGLTPLGEALGNNPSDPFPVGEEAFIQDHLRGVTEAVAADLRKIAALPNKLQDGQAGLQVAWALLAKTLPPRVVHLLRALPVSDTQTLWTTAGNAPWHCQTVLGRSIHFY